MLLSSQEEKGAPPLPKEQKNLKINTKKAHAIKASPIFDFRNLFFQGDSPPKRNNNRTKQEDDGSATHWHRVRNGHTWFAKCLICRRFPAEFYRDLRVNPATALHTDSPSARPFLNNL